MASSKLVGDGTVCAGLRGIGGDAVGKLWRWIPSITLLGGNALSNAMFVNKVTIGKIIELSERLFLQATAAGDITLVPPRISARFALFREWIDIGNGRLLELSVDPVSLEVRKFLGLGVRRDLRGNSEEVEDLLAYATVGLELDAEGLLALAAVGLKVDTGGKSVFPIFARSEAVACRKRLCIFGRARVMSSWIGAMCRSTSSRSICSLSPSL